MSGSDRDLGWEDVGQQRQSAGSGFGSFSVSGQMGTGSDTSGISDAVTSAMVNHFARELTQGSISLWPQLVLSARQYFNVTHGYVLRKAMWQLMPLTSMKKKFGDGELEGEKDWTVRVHHGLEVDVEEPDLYIPTMGFITYVLLCGVVRGIQEQFSSDTLSSTMSFAVVALVLETAVTKIGLVMCGAINAHVVDLVALLGYKFFYLSVQLMLGLLLGAGGRPGFLYNLLSLGLHISCGVALWQALRRLARMQAHGGQECMGDMHKLVIKAVPMLQVVVCWILLPSWPKKLAPHIASASEQFIAAGASAIVAATSYAPEVAASTTFILAAVNHAAGAIP